MKRPDFKIVTIGAVALALPILGLTSARGQSAVATTDPSQPPAGDTAAQTPPESTTPNTGNEKSSWNEHFFGDFKKAAPLSKEANGFVSSVQLSEKNDSYVVWMSMPQPDIKNAKAEIESGNVLHVSAGEKHQIETPATEAQGGTADVPAQSLTEKSHFEQMIDLPGPVDASKMKVDRQESSLTITIPKVVAANESTPAAPPQ